MTILAAMSPKAKEDESRDTAEEMGNLWAIRSITDYNSWFLGVDTATEVTENFRDFDHPPVEENCVIAVESVQVTLECGLGHRTVPLLLAESKFSGNVKNWTSLMAAAADMTLEVWPHWHPQSTAGKYHCRSKMHSYSKSPREQMA